MTFGDGAAVLWFHHLGTPPPWVATLSEFGTSQWYLLGALAVYLLSRDSLWRARSALLFWGVAASGILVNIVKALLGRPRPEVFLEQGQYGFQFLEFQADYLSFPSGHATTIFSVATCLALFWPRWRYAFLALAGVIASTRVVLLHHFPSDVLAGAWLGTVTVLWLYTNRTTAVSRAPALNWA
jgi:membrane-associated phospholipid phosphatase